MHDFRSSDRRQVSVSLIGNHDLVGTGPLQSGGGSRSAAVRDLHVAYVKIIVSKYRAPYRTYEDSLILNTQFLQSLGD